MAKSTIASAAPMESNPSIATRYDYVTIPRPTVDFDQSDPNSRSITNQSDKDSVDINKIMERYEKTGLITVNGVSRTPVYGDFTATPDFYSMQVAIAKTQQAFDALPAATRSRFNHNPQELVDFLADPANDAEAVELGLKSESDVQAEPAKGQAPAAKPAAPDQAVNPPANPSGAPAKAGS